MVRAKRGSWDRDSPAFSICLSHKCKRHGLGIHVLLPGPLIANETGNRLDLKQQLSKAREAFRIVSLGLAKGEGHPLCEVSWPVAVGAMYM